MYGVVAYLISWLLALLAFFYIGINIFIDNIPSLFHSQIEPFISTLMGGIGACTYNLRAVYLQNCVKNNWDPNWHVWYYIKPLIGLICGFLSWLLLDAGLVILEATRNPNATQSGYKVLAFIAGYNCDKFLLKLEDISSATWGIEKSRASQIKKD